MKKFLTIFSVFVLLIFNGISQCNAADSSTAIVSASLKGDSEKVQKLLDAGVDINSTAKIKYVTYSVLTAACANGNYQLVKYLIEKGANVRYGDPLSWAAEHPDIVKLLLDSGADVNARSIGGTTPAMNAVLHIESLRMILEAGANPNLEDRYGHTALWYAQVNNLSQAAQLIRQYGGIVTNP